MQDTINSNQTAPQTGNPQNVNGANNANNGADFQSTAPSDVLNQNLPLEVQQTGEPLDRGQAINSSNSASLLWWGIIILAIVVVGSISLIKLLKKVEKTVELQAAEKELADEPVKLTAKTTTKKAVRKTSSGKPVAKKRKKSSKKRR